MSPSPITKGTVLKLLEQSLKEGQPKEVIERLQWILFCIEHQSISKTCRHFGIARSTFYRWFKRFNPSDIESLTDRPTSSTFKQHKEVPERRVVIVHKHETVPATPVHHKNTFLQRLGVLLPPSIQKLRLYLLLFGFFFANFVLMLSITHAFAASSWNPTVLVNTEAFQVIDDDDTASDVYIQFGDSLAKSLTYERSATLFRFDDDLYVSGTMSGYHLHAQNLLTSSGTLTVEGNVYFPNYNCSGNDNGGALTVGADGLLTCTDDDSGGAATVTLQDAYDNDTDGSVAAIDLTSTDGSVLINNPSSGGTAGTGAFIVDQDAATMTGILLDSEATGAPGLAIDMPEILYGYDSIADNPHILFGYAGTFDTNLFRSAANYLKTNDNFIIDGTLTLNGVEYTFPANAGSVTGSLLATDGTSQLSWKQDTSALVWYLDGDITTGTNLSASVIMPSKFIVTGIEMDIKTAPVGSSLIIDINEAGSSIYSTRPEIDAGGTGEDGNEVLSDTSLAVGSKITLDVDQVGSGTAGNGLTVILKGYRP